MCVSEVAHALLRAASPLLATLGLIFAQDFKQRGFLETSATLYPETAPNDSSHAISISLFRYEASYKVRPGLRFSGAIDSAFDTHQQVERSLHLDWQDRSLRRPALSLREFNAT